MSKPVQNSADSGFSYSQDRFRELVDQVLDEAKKLGATDAGAEVSEGCGLSVSTRPGQAGERRAQPRQVAGHLGLRRPAPRQCEHLGLLDEGAAGHRPRRLRHRALHRGRPRSPACPTTTTCRSTRAHAPSSISSTPGPSMRRRRPRSRCAAKRRSSTWTSASPTARAPPSRPSSRTSSPATAGASAAATPARAIRSRWRRSPAAAPACSATPGTARCAMRPELASAEAVGRYAAERALSRLKAKKVKTAEGAGACSRTRWPPACSAA